MYVRVHVTSESHVTSLVIKGKQDYIGSDLDLWTLGPKANARQQRWLKHVKKSNPQIVCRNIYYIEH